MKKAGASVFFRFWLRVYTLCFLLYLLGALVVLVWLIVSAALAGGHGLGSAGVWALFAVPLGLGVTLPVSAVVAGVWGAAVLAGGGTLEPPPRHPLRRAPGGCRGCGYDLAGLDHPGRCPECGELVASGEDEDRGEGARPATGSGDLP